MVWSKDIVLFKQFVVEHIHIIYYMHVKPHALFYIHTTISSILEVSKKKHLEQYQIMNLLSFLTLHSNLPFRYLRSAEFVSLRGPMRLWRGPG